MQNTPEQILHSAWEILNANVAALEKGEQIDLTEFDNKTREFCDSLKILHPLEAKKYKEDMRDLLNHLSGLTGKLELERDELEEKISSLNKRNIAYNAYGNAMFLALQTVESEEK